MAITYKQIIQANGRLLLAKAKWCDSFLTKLRGFTFRKEVPPDEGLVLVYSRDTRVETAIHMFFVPFPLGVIWVNRAGKVVDSLIAQPWRPSYVPAAPAAYVIEGHPNLLQQIQIGDELRFE